MKQVSAGIIICNDRILIARRSHNKSNAALWEFPGGKQEPGETMPECLRREISEELHLDIEVGSFFMNSVYEYEQGAICLHVYYAYTQSYDICFHSDDLASGITGNVAYVDAGFHSVGVSPVLVEE